jgi:hypothetical protein
MQKRRTIVFLLSIFFSPIGLAFAGDAKNSGITIKAFDPEMKIGDFIKANPSCAIVRGPDGKPYSACAQRVWPEAIEAIGNQ